MSKKNEKLLKQSIEEAINHSRVIFALMHLNKVLEEIPKDELKSILDMCRTDEEVVKSYAFLEKALTKKSK